jgi:hypothetical protein
MHFDLSRRLWRRVQSRAPRWHAEQQFALVVGRPLLQHLYLAGKSKRTVTGAKQNEPSLILTWADHSTVPAKRKICNQLRIHITYQSRKRRKIRGEKKRFLNGMSRRVTLKRTDISEKLIPSIIKVTRMDKLGTALAMASNWSTCVWVPVILSAINHRQNPLDSTILLSVLMSVDS